MSEKIATRDAYGKTLVELGRENSNIVVLDADLSKSTKTEGFAKQYPDRFFQMGIAEQDLMATAAGLAAVGKIPFASTFAVFAAGRAFDQIRNSIGYPNLNVKIAATHAGITVGEDGGSHQSVEDIALMRVIPNMVVIAPADGVEASQAVRAAAAHRGPVYLRLGRLAVPTVFDENYSFRIGRAARLREGKDVAVAACGIMVKAALDAAEMLQAEGISARVIDCATIKPLDRQELIAAARETGSVVAAEEHSVVGGLGGAIAELLGKEYPAPMEFVGLQDVFGQSGTPEELLKAYKLTARDIAEACRKCMKRK
ncbi:MAG: transketolase family protein [Bacillota bacterium]